MSKYSPNYGQLTLIVILTPKVPISRWKHLGMFEREISLYASIAKVIKKVILVSDSKDDETKMLSEYENIEVWQKPRLNKHLHANRHLKNPNEEVIIKTNQTRSALTATYLKLFFRKPLIARSGYQLSDFIKRRKDLGLIIKTYYICASIIMEKCLFKFADLIIVTTEEASDYISNLHKFSAGVVIVPNYVETKKFKPEKNNKTHDIICVGRLSDQKNHIHLFNILSQTGYSLAIVGEGEKCHALKQKAAELDLNVDFLGQRPSDELPTLLNNAKIFALCSDYEGDPKTLIEAMSCGLPTLTKSSQGCRTVVETSNSGIATDDINEARNWLHEVLNDERVYRAYSVASRSYSLKERSLDKIVSVELRLYQKLLKRQFNV